MAERRRERELSYLLGSDAEGWTQWKKAMVPQPDRDTKRCGDTKRRRHGQVGFMCTKIKSAFRDQARHCGIYEWRAKGTLPNQPNNIVYVGSTCWVGEGALKGRIMQYCTNGSHQKDLINAALSKGYELWVRVKISKGRHNAKDMEDNLLCKYDYAWNTQNNGSMRNILPKARKR